MARGGRRGVRIDYVAHYLLTLRELPDPEWRRGATVVFRWLARTPIDENRNFPLVAVSRRLHLLAPEQREALASDIRRYLAAGFAVPPHIEERLNALVKHTVESLRELLARAEERLKRAPESAGYAGPALLAGAAHHRELAADVERWAEALWTKLIDSPRAREGLRHACIKNWLFLGSDEGARVNTVFVTLLASCQLHGIEPWAYLRDLLCLLPSWPKHRILELAPTFWQQTLQQENAQQRLAANVFRGVTLVDHAPSA